MISIRLDSLFRRQADQAKAAMRVRLAAGVDVNGRPLAPKKRDDGRRLGGDRVPEEIARGAVSVRPDRWSISVAGVRTTQFQRGDSDQPARKVVGLSRAERAKFQRETEDEVARQITAQLARGAR